MNAHAHLNEVKDPQLALCSIDDEDKEKGSIIPVDYRSSVVLLEGDELRVEIQVGYVEKVASQ